MLSSNLNPFVSTHLLNSLWHFTKVRIIYSNLNTYYECGYQGKASIYYASPVVIKQVVMNTKNFIFNKKAKPILKYSHLYTSVSLKLSRLFTATYFIGILEPNCSQFGWQMSYFQQCLHFNLVY